eukprot:g8486.t1
MKKLMPNLGSLTPKMTCDVVAAFAKAGQKEFQFALHVEAAVEQRPFKFHAEHLISLLRDFATLQQPCLKLRQQLLKRHHELPECTVSGLCALPEALAGHPGGEIQEVEQQMLETMSELLCKPEAYQLPKDGRDDFWWQQMRQRHFRLRRKALERGSAVAPVPVVREVAEDLQLTPAVVYVSREECLQLVTGCAKMDWHHEKLLQGASSWLCEGRRHAELEPHEVAKFLQGFSDLGFAQPLLRASLEHSPAQVAPEMPPDSCTSALQGALDVGMSVRSTAVRSLLRRCSARLRQLSAADAEQLRQLDEWCQLLILREQVAKREKQVTHWRHLKTLAAESERCSQCDLAARKFSASTRHKDSHLTCSCFESTQRESTWPAFARPEGWRWCHSQSIRLERCCKTANNLETRLPQDRQHRFRMTVNFNEAKSLLAVPASPMMSPRSDISMGSMSPSEADEAEAEPGARKGRGGRTALHNAAQKGRGPVAELLLAARANVHATDQSLTCWTPLHLAAAKGHPDVVQMLLNAHASVDVWNAQGQTPLHEAANHGHASVVQLLLAARAFVDVTDDASPRKCGLCWTPLHFAAAEGHPEVTEILLQAKASINAEERLQGDTPLHLAANDRHAGMGKEGSVEGHHRVVQLLLAAGASADVPNRRGRTPCDIAQKNGKTKAREEEEDAASMPVCDDSDVEASLASSESDSLGTKPPTQTPHGAYNLQDPRQLVELLINAKIGIVVNGNRLSGSAAVAVVRTQAKFLQMESCGLKDEDVERLVLEWKSSRAEKIYTWRTTTLATRVFKL